MPTGGKERVLGGTGWLTRTVRYDEKYRTVQTVSDNIQNGADRATYSLDFAGRTLASLETHTGSATVTARRGYVYDHAGRTTGIWHTVNNADSVLLSNMGYNALGQLVDKKLHGDGQGNFLQSVDYRYNIRGWLTNINDTSLPTAGDSPVQR